MTVLLTGATGVVGVEVAQRLSAAGEPVTALVHRTARFVGNGGEDVAVAAVVPGDVRRPGFGLTGDLRAEAIVHCAATTDFGATEQEYDELNVAGTTHAIELARAWDVPLVYVSTAYVCGLRHGTVTEADLDVRQEFGNGYENSKFRAEHAVRAAHSDGVRACVVRPSIVVGRRSDGAIREYKNIYPVLKLIVEGKLRSLPGRYDATLQLVPVDHVADVIVAVLADANRLSGKTFHAIGADDLSLRAISDVLAEYPSFEVARFVPPSTFAADDLEPIEREYYRRVGSLYTSYFARRVSFDATNTVALGVSPPRSDADFLRLLLDSCLESGYLGRPLPSILDVLARVGRE